MQVKVKYFGRIVEQTGLNEEEILLAESISIAAFKNELLERFPTLENETFTIALDQELVGDNVSIQTDCEIAILPPFAGG